MIRKVATLYLILLYGCATTVPPLINNTSSALRLNGFYYVLSSKDNDFVSIYFLYKNGVCYYNGSKEYKNKKELDMILDEEAGETYKHPASNAGRMYGFWGNYEIRNDSITMRWQLLAPGKRITESRGLIMNDSTFFMYESREYRSGAFQKNAVAEYHHFRTSINKPDSTNIFLNKRR